MITTKPKMSPIPELEALRQGQTSVWMRPLGVGVLEDETPLQQAELSHAKARLARFQPVLAALFPDEDWDGAIASPLLDFPAQAGVNLLVKADHALPMTGSVKARGGVYELLCHVEEAARDVDLWGTRRAMKALLTPEARQRLATRRVVVASTGNLGFSIGLVARRFGLQAEIHMSHDAKAWKKQRLRAIGAQVIEHACDYSQTVSRARASAEAAGAYFIDDESSRRLFVGYATAARELADQLAARGLNIGPRQPLVVYLPCGVGGAPGGIAAGLKAIYGQDVLAVFVEPTASACVFAALAVGHGAPISVYDLGLDNDTIADGLAVPLASALVMRSIGRNIDAVVAVTDREMTRWVRQAWSEGGLRLEPSAASGFAAIAPLLDTAAQAGLSLDGAVHVVWTTGGSLLPDEEFEKLLGSPAA